MAIESKFTQAKNIQKLAYIKILDIKDDQMNPRAHEPTKTNPTRCRGLGWFELAGSMFVNSTQLASPHIYNIYFLFINFYIICLLLSLTPYPDLINLSIFILESTQLLSTLTHFDFQILAPIIP